MSTPDSSTHAAETVPKKRRRSEAPPGASSTGPWAASSIGVGGAFSMVSHDVTDRFGRRMYLATQGSARAWVSADALPQRLVLEYATAGTIGGAPARCQNAACARPLRRDAPSKYCCRACGLAAARRLLAARIAAHARHADGADLRAPRAAAFTPRVERAPTAAPTAAGASTGASTGASSAPVSWLADVERERAGLEAENARLAQQLAAGRAELEALRGTARVACTDDGGDDSAGASSADAGRKSGSGFYQCPLCLRSLTPAAFVRHVTSCYETPRRRNMLVESEYPIDAENADLYCGAVINTRIRQLYCHRLKASCPLHGGPLAAGASDSRSSSGTAWQCGFVGADGAVCTVREDQCVRHCHWRAYREAELLQSAARTARCIAANSARLARLARQHDFATAV